MLPTEAQCAEVSQMPRLGIWMPVSLGRFVGATTVTPNSGVVFGRQFSLAQNRNSARIGTWLDSKMVPIGGFLFNLTLIAREFDTCAARLPGASHGKAINRAEGCVSLTTDDDFQIARFLRERVMMLCSAHPTHTRRTIWDRGYFVVSQARQQPASHWKNTSLRGAPCAAKHERRPSNTVATAPTAKFPRISCKLRCGTIRALTVHRVS
jgi:hypothetical protein